MKKIVWSTLIGWVTLFVLSYIIYIYLVPLFAPGVEAADTELMRDDPLFLYFLLGHLFLAWVFTLVIKNWHPESNFSNGMKVGFTVSILLSIGLMLEFYGSSYLYENISGVITDVVVQVVRFTLLGGVIGYVLSRFNEN